MKNVLSLLVVYVFLETQTWALSGGPVFATGAPNLAGHYSGVLVPKETRFNFDGISPGTNVNNLEPLLDTSGKIGVFAVSIPITGMASGDAIIFFNGGIFTGNIDGIADPDRGTFDGIIQLESTFDIVSETDSTESTTPSAQGEMSCKIVEKPTTPQPGRADTSVGNAARMTGEANIDSFVSVDETGRPVPIVQVRFKVVGYRQDTTALP